MAQSYFFEFGVSGNSWQKKFYGIQTVNNGQRNCSLLRWISDVLGILFYTTC